jgi:hypothetical protein
MCVTKWRETIIIIIIIIIIITGLQSREYCRRDPSRWPRGTPILYWMVARK